VNVSLHEVSVSYGAVRALCGIDVEIAPGQWFAPIGPNGAGKSTLLRAIAGQLAFSGSISLGERALPISSHMRLARLVAFVPQRPELPSSMTVADYVMLGRTPYIGYLGAEKTSDRRIVSEVLDRLSLGSFAKRHLGAISGGEAQRAVLGRALAQGAPLLCLDEPTSSLDIGHQLHVLELVDELRKERGLTVISAMHDLTMAGQFADVLCLLVSGRVVKSGDAQSVLTKEAISLHYGASVDVNDDGAGGVVIVPRRARRETS
jgi:iron complex transport system ATP-binding protein